MPNSVQKQEDGAIGLTIRPLCLIEESLAFASICTVEIVNIKGAIARRQIENQFERFLDANPILSARVKGAPGSRYFERAARPSLLILDNCCASQRSHDISGFSSSSNCIAENKPLDLSINVFKMVVLRESDDINQSENDTTSFIFFIDHVAGDARSICAVIHDFLIGLSSPDTDILEVKKVFPESLCNHFRSLGMKFVENTYFLEKRQELAVVRNDPFVPYFSEGERPFKKMNFEFSMSVSDTKMLLDHCRKNQITLFTLMLACLLKSYWNNYEHNEVELKVAFAYPFNMRPFASPPLDENILCNFATTGWCSILLYKEISVLAIVEKILQRQKIFVDNCEAQRSVLELESLEQFRLGQSCGFVFSYFGFLSLQESYNNLELLDFNMSANSSLLPIPTFNAYIRSGKLIFSHQCAMEKSDAFSLIINEFYSLLQNQTI